MRQRSVNTNRYNVTSTFFSRQGNRSCICACIPLHHMYFFVCVKCTREFMVCKEKHFSFHHSCTFSNPKEASPWAARCPEDEREQLRLPLSTEPSGAWPRPAESSWWSATSIKNITGSPLPSCSQQGCLRGQRADLLSYSCAHTFFQFNIDANTGVLNMLRTFHCICGPPWIKLVLV